MRRSCAWSLVLGALCVSLSVKTASAALLDADGFIRDWVVSGPWPNYQVDEQSRGLDTDFFEAQGGERQILPFPDKPETATFEANREKLVAALDGVNEWGWRQTRTVDATWREWRDAKVPTMFDGRFLPVDDYFVVYAACYIQTSRQIDCELLVGSDDDHRIYLDQKVVGQAISSQAVMPGSFRYPIHLGYGLNRLLFKLQDRRADCGFCVQLVDKEGKPLQDVTIFTDSRGRETTLEWCRVREISPKRLRERAEAARTKLADLNEKLAAATARRKALQSAVETSDRALQETFVRIEREYAAQHAAAAAKGRKGVDEPLAAGGTPRASLCLNGRWESSADEGKTWGRTYLPAKLLPKVLAPVAYPIAWDSCKPLPGFEQEFDPVTFAVRSRFRTHFAWDGETRVVFRCDAIHFVRTDVLLNGRKVGQSDGNRGIVSVPLEGLQRGDNVLELQVTVPPESEYKGNVRRGICGDLWLDFSGDVRAEDVWVKTSWRESVLRAETTLANDTDRPVEAEISAAAVRDGRVRFRLPVVRTTVPAHGTARATARDVWRDPELWGLGNGTGGPNVYTLVTDVRVGGRTVDRHETEFGFREFWINRTEFYLNGRRVFLQGDVGSMSVDDKRGREILWPLYRADGVNMIRVHDSEQWSLSAVRDADRMGMAIYAQMYPPRMAEYGAMNQITNFSPFATWTSTRAHRDNLVAYERWWKSLRNHPSVLIWSTDNEIVTQCWNVDARAEYNTRNEQVGALYEKYVKSLDPDLVMTRDGDVGTWSRRLSRWFEDPPCDTANYHYPNEDDAKHAVNWRARYDYRPAVFGETLYSKYWDQIRWVGPTAALIAKSAADVRRHAAVYVREEVPCVIYMGLGLDGFCALDESGNGNPWGIRPSDIKANKEKGSPVPGRRPCEYPWMHIPWPAYSGEGGRPPAVYVPCTRFGMDCVNLYDESRPSHVRNAVNDAYRAVLRPQPPIKAGRFAEAVVRTRPGASVWTTTTGGLQTGVRADEQGRAWFRSLTPGSRVFESCDVSKAVDLVERGEAIARPGFAGIPEVDLVK